jgi:hypothetical protein
MRNEGSAFLAASEIKYSQKNDEKFIAAKAAPASATLVVVVGGRKTSYMLCININIVSINMTFFNQIFPLFHSVRCCC